MAFIMWPTQYLATVYDAYVSLGEIWSLNVKVQKVYQLAWKTKEDWLITALNCTMPLLMRDRAHMHGKADKFIICHTGSSQGGFNEQH